MRKLSGPQATTEKTNNIDSDILTFNALKLQIEQLGGHLEIMANSSVGSSIKVRF